METYLKWRDEYNIGLEVIDKEHQQAVSAQGGKKNRLWACQEGIKFFGSHAVEHFADEERYMESIGYEGLKQHREIHNCFRVKGTSRRATAFKI